MYRIRKRKGGNDMKKILSILLVLCMMISLCSVFAIMPSFAGDEGASSDSPVYDASEEGFGISVTDKRGLNVGIYGAGLTEEQVYTLYTEEYDDTVGKHTIEGSELNTAYEVFDYSGLLKGDSAASNVNGDWMFGGYWCASASANLPMNQFPINMDVDLNGAKVISGVQLDAAKKDANGGAVLAYDVYVKFEGDDDWTYIISDGTATNAKVDMETAFGQNLEVTHVRVSVTKTKAVNANADTEHFEKGVNAYFHLNKLSILKPYNNGGAKYTTAPATATCAEELDEIIVKATNSGFTDTGRASATKDKMKLYGMDGDLSTNTYTNGVLSLDFGTDVVFGGIRYYPPKSYGNGTFQPIVKIGSLSVIDGKIAVSDEGVADLSAAKLTNPGYTESLAYPTDSANNTDYTKPVTIMFNKPVKANGISISGWKGPQGTEGDERTDGGSGNAAACGVGEIRLVKWDEHMLGYDTDDVIDWDWGNAPHIESFKSTNGMTYGTSSTALFDRKIYTEGIWTNDGKYSTGADWGIDDTRAAAYNEKNVKTAGFGRGYVNLVIDLGETYEFSAVRLFTRLGQPGQSLMEGNLYISDDGENWSLPMAHSDTVKKVDWTRPAVDDKGNETNPTSLLYYNGTEDIYTEMKGSCDGQNVNLSARYIKIEAKKTFQTSPWNGPGQHFSAQELLLVKPKSGLSAKSASDFADAVASADYTAHGYYNDKVVHWASDTDSSVAAPKVVTKKKIAADETETDHGYFATTGKDQLFDKKIGQDRYEDLDRLALNNNGLSFDWAFTKANSDSTMDGSSVYFTVDLGQEYSFSAVRLFHKPGQPYQSFKKGDISFSADGQNWFTAFDHEEDYTVSGNVAGIGLPTYATTGDIYTDVYATINGAKKNVTARYIKVHATESKSEHVGIGELMLVKENQANGEALTAAKLEAAVDSYISEIKTKIDAIGDVDNITMNSADAITAARAAYETLLPSQKAKFETSANGYLEKLKAAENKLESYKVSQVEALITALPEAEDVSLEHKDAITAAKAAYDELSSENKEDVNNSEKLKKVTYALSGLTYTLNMNVEQSRSDFVGNGTYMGTAKATYTIYGDKKISKITYNDADYTEADGYFTQSAANGMTTLVIGGLWPTSEYAHTDMGKDLAEGKKAYALSDIPRIGIKEGDEFKLEGKLVQEIAMDNPMGKDHYITVTFEDETTKTINLETLIKWTNVTNAVATGKLDELTPTTDWKVAETDGRTNMGGFLFANGTQGQKYWESPFQGYMDRYLESKGGLVKESTLTEAEKKQASVVVAASAPRAGITTDKVKSGEVKLYTGYTTWVTPTPMTFYVDLADNSEPYNGVRFYGREYTDGVEGANVNVGLVDIWGSNDGEEWTQIVNSDDRGNLKENTDVDKELIFFEDGHTVSYRYLQFRVGDLKKNTPTTLNIKNLSIVKPYITVDAATVIQDPDDDLVEDSEFTFNLIDGTETIESVKKGTTLLGDEAYTYSVSDKIGTLTVKADWTIANVTEGEQELTVTFSNDNVLKVNIKREDVKTLTYYITGSASGAYSKGTSDLVLTALAGMKAQKVVIKEQSVSFGQTGSDITIARKDFRGLDIWEDYNEDSYVNAVVTYKNGKSATYEINLSASTYKVVESEIGSKFESDEIKAKASWTLKTDTSEWNSNVAMILQSNENKCNWHSGHTGGTADSTKGHYLDIDLGEETEFSGIRYYSRTDDNSGLWYNVRVFGRNGEDEPWTAISDTVTWKYDTSTTGHKQTLPFDSTAKCRYVRIYMNNNQSHATARYLRLLTPKTAFKGAEMVQDPVAMDFDLGESATAKVKLNGAGAIDGISHKGAAVPSEYLTMTADTVSISPYFFKDKNIATGDTAEFTLSFRFGGDVKFNVAVGAVDGNTFTFENITGDEYGGITASAYNEKVGVSEQKKSGDKVRSTDKLTFTAVANEGYEVDEWTVESTTKVYERVADSEKTRWKATANSDTGSTIGNTIDGNTDSDNNYWHSKYHVYKNSVTGNNATYSDWQAPDLDENGEQQWNNDGTLKLKNISDQIFPYVLEYDFSGTIKNAKAFEYIPRTGATITTNTVKDYKIYVVKEGETEWTEVASGTLAAKYDGTVKIPFSNPCSITKLKFEIHSLNGSYAYINEVYLWAEKLPTGKVTRTGTASQDFEIDDRFTDMKVSVSFKEAASGIASVKTELRNLTSDAKASYPAGQNAVIKLTADKGYWIDGTGAVTVTKDGTELDAGTDYFVAVAEDGSSAAVTVHNASGAITIKAAGTPTKNNHKVTYKDDLGATGTLPSEAYVLEGDKFTVASGSNLTLTGYKFAGWTSSNDIAAEGEEEKLYTAGDKLTMGEADIIFTAKWTKDNSKTDETGTVKPKPTQKPATTGSTSSGGGGGVGGGAGTGTVFTVTINGVTSSNVSGTIVPAPEAPEGYTFTGWYLDEAHTVPYANTGVTENLTLYPAYEKNRSGEDLTDVKGHWAEGDIVKLYEKKIVNGSGEGKYNPDDSITRAEFIQILYNMSGMTSDGSHKFKDVKVGDWFLQAVAWAVNYNITSGTSEDEFSPYEKITREQMAAMIYRYATLMGADWQTDENGEFADGHEISEYAKYYVRWAKGMGIINGRDDGTFGPKDNATRAESAAMLSRLVK